MKHKGKKVPFYKTMQNEFQRGKRMFAKFLRSMRKTKLSSRRSNRRSNVENLFLGRNIRTKRFSENDQLAVYPTIISAVSGGGFSGLPLRIPVSTFLAWKKSEQEAMTLIFVIDLSNSTYPYIQIFSRILDSTLGYFSRNKDRVGLITLQGRQARIHNHPTHNFRVVLKNLKTLSVQGESPVADGLNKALHMASIEKHKNPDSTPLVIMLSDCFPEPITGDYDDLFDEPAYRDTLTAATQYRHNKISLLLITPYEKDVSQTNPGYRLSHMIAENSGGRIIELKTSKDAMFVGDTNRAMTHSDDIDKIIKGIESTYFKQKQSLDSDGLTIS